MTEQEEENGGGTKGRPNAFWARVREEQIEEAEGDTFGGGFRGVRPAPHGGAVTVTAHQIIGAEELCWCGQPVGHSWPGKQVGAKHPKVENVSTAANDTLDRRDLRAFHRRLQDFVIHCVSENGVRFRQTKNGVILYPPDGSTPMTVHARNTDRQLRQLQKWYLEHVHPGEPVTPVTDEAIKRLIETKNDPVEHPVEEKEPKQELHFQDEPAQPEEYLPSLEVESVEPEEPVSPNDEPAEWVPVQRQEGGPSPNIVTNGEQFRCILCAGTDHEYLKSVQSQGGHNRMYHTDTSNMHGTEARVKAIETSRAKRQAEKVASAIDILIEAVGYKTASESALADWQHKYNAMKERAEKADRKVEELEAKLALIREATGL